MPKKTGRPPRFDRDEAVAQAMSLFWRSGYEGTTLEALLEAMGGISPPSFYNAFGSKEALFKEVVDRYAATIGAAGIEALEAAPTAYEGIHQFLLANAQAFASPGGPRGCLLVSGASKCAAGNQGAEGYVAKLRRQAPHVLAARLRRAVADGEIPDGVDLDLVAGFYVMVVHGLAMRAVDGESRKRLIAIAEHAMTAWRGLAQAVPKGGSVERRELPQSKAQS